ncbi:MAG: hypothetical protein HYR72_13485 [Deltaproteobacteria bacterium]|nr:hypothetical protein [Deltaproteobacteria bacterium]MBI3391214.1 hypothetical protein [Deltaproteobacteria bacterium]
MSPAAATSPASHRLVWAVVLTGVLAGALLWRLPVAAPEWRFTLCENDSLYQLHRIQDCLRQYPHVPSIDRFSHYPHGYRVHWLALHSLFYATVAKLAGVGAEQRDALIALLSWIPPLFGLLAVALAVAIARGFTDSVWCLALVGVLCAFSADVCRPFFFGTIDHHLFAHVGTLLLVWGRLRRHALGWLLGLLALIGMTPEAILYVSLLLGCVFASELTGIASNSDPEPRAGWFWFLSPSAVAIMVVVAQRGLETDPLPLADLSWTYPTLFQPLWLATLGVSMSSALNGFERVVRMRHSLGRVSLGTAAALALVALPAVAVLYWTGTLATIVGRMMISNRIFVGEEAPVFQAGFWGAPAWYRLLAFSGLFICAKLWAGARAHASTDYWFRWIVLAAALLFGFKEFRHLYILSSLQVIGLAVAAFETVRALRRLPLFSSRVTRWLPAGVMALTIGPIFYTGDLADRVAIHGDACARMPVIAELTDWLRAHTPDPAPIGDGTPSYGVFSPWSIGHQLRVLADRPVIVDPFNFEIAPGTEQTLDRVWQSRGADEFTDALRAQPARYLVLMNPAEEIVGTLRRSGVRSDRFVTFDASGAPVFRPAMNQFAAFRLFMTSGWSGEFGQLQPRFFSRDAEIYTAGGDGGEQRRVAIPKGQIYELKPGATLTGNLPTEVQTITASYVVRTADAPPAEVRIPLSVNRDGRFEFHTALPAPVEEDSFRVDGGYRFTAGERIVVVAVTQAMVDTHAAVSVEW